VDHGVAATGGLLDRGQISDITVEKLDLCGNAREVRASAGREIVECANLVAGSKQATDHM
jgi:hypothetical protein